MIDVDPAALGSGLLAATALGGCLGFATKRIVKQFAVILGVELMIVRYLQSTGIVTVDWNRLAAGFLGRSGEAAAASGALVGSAVSALSIVGGFVGGFLIGYHRG